MTGDEIKAARHALGLSQVQLANMLGYEGFNRKGQVDDLETERRPLRRPQQLLIEAYLAGYRPNDWGRTHEYECTGTRDGVRECDCGAIRYRKGVVVHD